VKQAIYKCKNKKAPGTDRIPAEFLNNATLCYVEELTTVYNRVFDLCAAQNHVGKILYSPYIKHEHHGGRLEVGGSHVRDV